MESASKIMAVILNYNSYEDSIKCAELLKKQSYENLQIVIVDNLSTDGSGKRLESYCRENHINFMQSNKNAGFSAGNNIGLKKAQQEGCRYSLIINPDVEIRDEDYVKKAVKKMESDDKIAVLGSDVITMERKHQNPMRELNFFENTFWFIMLTLAKLSKKDLYVGDYRKSGYVHKVSGCCFFVNLDFIKDIGYLDEQVFMYCEEPILAAQVKKAGMREYYYAEIEAYHMHKNLGHGVSAEGLARFYDSRIYYIEKYRYSGLAARIVAKSIRWQKKFMIKKNR
jgi:hypothetical protein